VAAETQPAGLEITRDGVAVGPAQWGSMVPVDPGPHEILARAPGRQTYSRSVNAEEGVVLDFELPALAPSTDPAAAPTPPSSPPLEEKAPPAAHSGPSPWVYALGGAGIVGLGVGTTFAFMAMSDNKDSKANCRTDDPNKCTAEGIEQRNSAIKKGNAATVGFVVGGVGIASALVVWLLGSSGDAQKTGVTAGGNIGQNGGELHLSGSF
jgi:hypothetical protein